MFRRNQKVKILKSLSFKTKWIVWNCEYDVRVPKNTITKVLSMNKDNNTFFVSIPLYFKATKNHSSWWTRVDIESPIDTKLVSKLN